MNLGLYDPFRMANVPDTVEDCLMDSINSKAHCCSFNRRGTILAVGCQQGQISLWDFDTKSIARMLISHKQTVNYLCWSRNGKNLLSVSNDGSLIYWDLDKGTVEKRLDLEIPLLFVQVHPRDKRYCIICTNGIGIPLLVYMDEEGSKPQQLKYEPVFDPSQYKGDLNIQSIMTASFNRKGTKLFIGDGNGMVSVMNWKSKQFEKSFKVSASSIKAFEFSRNCKMMLINSNDKVLRLYNILENGDYHFTRDYSDNVNRVQWRRFGFSNNNEYVYGGMNHKSIQSILVWNVQGGLVKGLEGPKEGLLDVTWHPFKPVIISISYTGLIYIWSVYYTETWSSFAPDFQELEENEEYIEKEDEFDYKSDDENEEKKKKEKLNDKQRLDNGDQKEHEEIDIMSLDKMNEYSSDEEEDVFLLSTLNS